MVAVTTKIPDLGLRDNMYVEGFLQLLGRPKAIF